MLDFGKGITEDNQELTSNILQKTREKTEYTMQEIMIITAIKRLQNRLYIDILFLCFRVG